LLHDTTGVSSIGIVEALPFIGPTLWLEWKVRRFLARHPLDLVILVDYVGVNHRMGDRLQRLGIPVVYYIAPHEWVWTFTSRMAQKLARFSRLILAIFAAEAEYYSRAGGNVRWVGHPLLDILQDAPSRAEARDRLGIAANAPIVVLLPASRSQELRTVLPRLLQAAQILRQQQPDLQFWLPLSRPQFRRAIAQQARQYGIPIALFEGESREILAAADVVLAKSGTVNLEVALLGVPQVVVYAVNPFTYWIGTRWLKLTLRFISPVNIAMDRSIVPELLQAEAQPERIAAEAIALLTDDQRQSQLQRDYVQLRLTLGQSGVLERAAAEILRLLDERQEELKKS
jgi:lipid-A-disaccharide synthase